MPAPKKKSQRTFAEMPLAVRQADIRSFDEKTRVAEMIFSTGAQVKRNDWWTGESWVEELSLDPAHVNLKRVADGSVPFLKNHGGWSGASIEDVMGRVIEASADGAKGVAKVQFSSREDIQPFVQDIKDGILRSVSVGYRINKLEKVGERDGIPVLRATDWELLEISSVAIPADSLAQFRGAEGGREQNRLFRCEVRGYEPKEKTASEIPVANETGSTEDETSKDQIRENGTMTPEELKAQAEKKAADEKRAAEEAAKQKAEGASAERERQKQIRHAVRAAGFEDSYAEELCSSELTVDQARTQVIDKLAEKNRSAPTASPRVEGGGQDEVQTRRSAVAEAIMHRGDPSLHKLTALGRNYAGMTLMEMARELLRQQRVDVGGLSRMKLAERAMHATSDFPFITENVLNKSLRDAFLAAPQTFEPLTRRVQNPDFKEISRNQLGLGSGLSEIAENGEVTYGTMGEANEKYRVKQYAKGFSIGAQALINDDLDAFVRIPSQMGAKARSLESDVVWALLTANAAMGDGVALFHADHGNQAGAPGAIAIATLAAGRAAVRSQKEMDGEHLNLPVQWLVVPVALETVAEQYISQVQPNVQTSNNPFAPGGRTPLGLIVEPRLDADSLTKWYLASQKSLVDMIELATLSGSTEPEISTEMGFDVLGVKFRVVHAVGAKVIDWRGLYRNS